MRTGSGRAYPEVENLALGERAHGQDRTQILFKLEPVSDQPVRSASGLMLVAFPRPGRNRTLHATYVERMPYGPVNRGGY